MGQKVNPNIFRIGKIKDWTSRYTYEKKTTESSTLIINDIEIKNFIYKFFSNYQLKINYYQTSYSKKTLYVYISYFNLSNPLLFEKKTTLFYKKKLSKDFKDKISHIKTKIIKDQLYKTKVYKQIFLKKTILFMNQYLLKQKSQRFAHLNYIQTFYNKFNYKNLNQKNYNLFISKIIKGINLFTKKNHNIFLNVDQINKENTIFKTLKQANKYKLRKKLISLRKYQQTEFFSAGLNTIHNFILKNQDPQFLAKFISSYLKRLKRKSNLFIRFLETSFKTFLQLKLYNLLGIQIKIRGKFNARLRSKKQLLSIGNAIPIGKITAKINYGEAISFCPNGTSSVKVWVLKK